ncbi:MULTISPECIES: TetR/AcrR family transcriptional regulator [Gammaproteobacteria]|uniref:TetR/AcrR family transcriptional regulator n=1 Tax=Gammaproteobacteria TaxID=1236 RepID=UPI001E53A8AB|nr:MULTISPECIES: TetR/AcrR family transcriptional regulator [Gammaproteobacteria]MDP4944868.1 TetR/AcrR family transcriptional regulator [Alishewanella sp.]MCC5453100.1 TetR/AcrR family transcriptional regulator [Rheinheimera sp. UJ51]MCF4010433.1 TetR/AcrR family transcriptional regulator [Rheinheimera sp. UJ63]MDP5034739.1 TetR/AcrR family transcriptional regulator [Alishewanella sp.]MDP5185554.1 TetR/AcrR family transcriptional regulator [Alishewanella sp.]
MTVTSCPQSVGRPRAFDTDTALEKALEVFWRRGYDGTSLADLTEAMGINKPSLYAAFGNKEQLFLKAIELYESRPCSFFLPALEKPTAYQVAEHMLYGAANNMADKTQPQGCFVVQGALSCSEAASAVKAALINRRLAGEQKLHERFAQAKIAGDLPAHVDAEVLSRFMGTVLQGMAIQANNGATAEQLQQIAEMTLQAFPR